MHGATLERLYDCVLACRVVSRGHVPLYAIVATSWPWLCRARRGRGRGRRALDVVAVAVASRLSRRGRGVRRVLDVAVARRGRGCGVRRLFVAVVWLRHADEC